MNHYVSLNAKRVFRLALIISFLIFIITGCTKKFEELNNNPNAILNLSQNDMRSLFPNAIGAGVNSSSYIITTALFAGLYSQMFASTQPAQNSHRYNIVDDWVQAQWTNTYVRAMPPLMNIIEQTNDGGEPTLNAIARIWKVWTLHRTTDYWGPVPYFQIGSPESTISYDSQKDIYFDFFKELEEADVLLKNNIDKTSFDDADLIFHGDNAKWRKFGNTLRLRLAMRISNVEPAKAKEEAEKAVANGVMTDMDDDAYMTVSSSIPNGFNVCYTWNESRMSHTMESLQVGYNDPRIPKYWRPAVTDGQYRGLRNGLTQAQQGLAENSFDNNSNVSFKLDAANMYTNPQIVMLSSEAYFLRAEGALNGWNMGGGSAQEHYEKGIELSMLEWEVTDPAAINAYINGTSLPMAPGGMFNTPALTDIPVKFSIDPEKQREQIGTQKFLALYTQEHEAWADMRRSGYPKFYPLINSDNPDVPKDSMLRRITYLNIEKSTNGPAVEAAISLLGGPDNAATRLWWDVK